MMYPKSVRRWRRQAALCLAALAALACTTLAGRGGGQPASPAAGLWDCYGSEFGMGAYSGRIRLDADGVAGFKDYYADEVLGTWTYDDATRTVSFSSSLPLDHATYTAASGDSAESLSVSVRPGASVTHAEGGTIDCARSEPGITGPP
jgi:hypothetical protein